MIYRLLLSNSLLQGAGLVAGFWVQFILARTLSITDYGLYNFFFSMNSLIAFFATLGLPLAVLKILPNMKKGGQESILPLYLFGMVVISLATALGGLVTYSALMVFAKPEGASLQDYVPALAFLFPLIWTRFHAGLLKGMGRPYWGISIELTLREWLLLAVLGGMMMAGYQLEAGTTMVVLAVILAIVTLISMGVLARDLWTSLKATDILDVIRYHRKEWMQLSLPIMMISSGQFLLYRMDIIMVGLLQGAAAAGLYALALRISQAITLPVTSITTVFSPKAAQLYQEGQPEALKALYQQVRLFLVLSIGGIVLILSIFSEPVLALFGQDFVGAQSALLIILFSYAINSVFGPVVMILIMSEHEKTTMKITIIAALSNLLLNAILIPSFGLIGAAIATALSLNGKDFILYRMAKKVDLL